jgi:GNAT superfamily N-acetyltransferase
MIRQAAAADAARIVAFQESLAIETEGFTLDHATVVRGVNAVFDHPAKGFYLVAQEQGEVLGSLLITFEWSDWRNGQIAWIQSVFVDPAHRGKGIFKALYREVQRLCDERKWVGIRLYVERNNKRAKQVYAGLGMRGDHYEVMEWMRNQ